MSSGEGRPVKVKIMDKRTSTRGGAAEEAAPQPQGSEEQEAVAGPQEQEVMDQGAQEVEQAERDLLDDLRRLQAEFDNYRKRVLREQTAMTTRASARLVERLLPVLDNLERAVEHGEGGPEDAANPP